MLVSMFQVRQCVGVAVPMRQCVGVDAFSVEKFAA